MAKDVRKLFFFYQFNLHLVLTFKWWLDELTSVLGWACVPLRVKGQPSCPIQYNRASAAHGGPVCASPVQGFSLSDINFIWAHQEGFFSVSVVHEEWQQITVQSFANDETASEIAAGSPDAASEGHQAGERREKRGNNGGLFKQCHLLLSHSY